MENQCRDRGSGPLPRPAQSVPLGKGNDMLGIVHVKPESLGTQLLSQTSKTSLFGHPMCVASHCHHQRGYISEHIEENP